MDKQQLKKLLNTKVKLYNRSSFIEDDPISIPHRYKKKQDIEIAAFWTAMLAWGRRKTIIDKANELFGRMDNAPYDFIKNHKEKDRQRFESFVHRTFQPIDALYFLEFFQNYYKKNNSLEKAFSRHLSKNDPHVGNALAGFHRDFFDSENAPRRTRKHVSTPERNSSCKRLNMFLRWMVRPNDTGVDFGLWKKIKPAQLLIPLDVHVDRIARGLGMIERKQTDWKTVLELTAFLKQLDPNDPVKYDFALFGMGVMEKTI